MDVTSVLNRLIEIFGARLIVESIGDPFVRDGETNKPSWINFTIRGWASFEYENFELSEVVDVGVLDKTPACTTMMAWINGDIRDPQGNNWPRCREAEMRRHFNLDEVPA